MNAAITRTLTMHAVIVRLTRLSCLHPTQTLLELPPFAAASISRRQHLFYKASTQFSLGGIGSGSPPHFHMAAVNTLVYGRKWWWLTPPTDAVRVRSGTQRIKEER